MEILLKHWYKNIFNWPVCLGTLGIERRRINTYFKDPSRSNIYHQVRRVDKITIRFKLVLDIKMRSKIKVN